MNTNNIYGGVASDGRSRIWGEAFDNITHFENTISARETQEAFKVDTQSSHTGRRWTKFSNTSSYDSATDLLLNGDEKSKAKIDENGVAKVLIAPNRAERQRKTVLSVCGFLPHVPNFLAGRPNNMIAERVHLQRKRVLTVAYSYTAPASTDANEIQKTAANVLSAILLCERSGLRVNLWCCNVTNVKDDYTAVAVKVKDSGQHIDLMKIAYPMTHPAMLRRHAFKAIETMPGVPSTFVHGYGYCVFDNKKIDMCLDTLGIKADCILSFKQCRNMTREQIISEITKVNK